MRRVLSGVAGVSGVAALLVLGLSCGAAANGGAYPAGIPRGVRVDRIVVHKGDHLMEAWSGDTLVRTYEVAVGYGGIGPKRFEGDGRTPEGTYRIDSRHRSRSFQRFIHVSYPNGEDRRRYRRLRREGEVPEGAGIGGDIGIHGYPEGWAAIRRLFDWTAGCIAVDNDEIEELYRAVAPGAVIEILP